MQAILSQCKAQRVNLALKVLLVLKVSKAKEVHRVLKVFKAYEVSKVLKVKEVLLALDLKRSPLSTSP